MMRKLVVLAALAVLTLSPALPGLAQSGEELKALRKELEGIKQGQTAIQKDLEEMKALLRARPAGPAPGQAPAAFQGVDITVEGAPFKGDKNAKVTVVEFTDYQ